MNPKLVILVIVLLIIAIVVLLMRGCDGPDLDPVDSSPDGPDIEAPVFQDAGFNIDDAYDRYFKERKGFGGKNLDATKEAITKQLTGYVTEIENRNTGDLKNGKPVTSEFSYDGKVDGQYLRLVYLLSLQEKFGTDKQEEVNSQIAEAWSRILPNKELNKETKVGDFTLTENPNWYNAAYTQWLLLYAASLDSANEAVFWRKGGLAEQLLDHLDKMSKSWQSESNERTRLTPETPGKNGHQKYIDTSVATLGFYVLANLYLTPEDRAQGNVSRAITENDRFKNLGISLCTYFEKVHPKIDANKLGAGYLISSKKERASLMGAKVLYFVVKAMLAGLQTEEAKSHLESAIDISYKLGQDSAGNDSEYFKQVVVDTYTACYVARAMIMTGRACMAHKETRAHSPVLYSIASDILEHADSKDISSHYSRYYPRLTSVSGLHDLKLGISEMKKYAEIEKGDN